MPLLPSTTPSPALPPGVTGLDQQAELEAAGRHVLEHYGYRALADMTAAAYVALIALQGDGVRGAEAVDTDEIENLGALFHRLDAVAREGMA